MTTGIDYLGLVDNAHSNHLGGKIDYAALGWDGPTSPQSTDAASDAEAP
ncbi:MULTISPECIES: hypothetical protein [unclassified Streptomyces]|nr:hypothetical protein [Streptomyces sp. NBC_00589]WTI42289.1 hypothetical protein OIC96_48970 [Streptomyces sp. NBC_00775]WUB24029.1 hypothetical protein OHA51_00760 [Streptomyces sp. NBC_00589]